MKLELPDQSVMKRATTRINRSIEREREIEEGLHGNDSTLSQGNHKSHGIMDTKGHETMVRFPSRGLSITNDSLQIRCIKNDARSQPTRDRQTCRSDMIGSISSSSIASAAIARVLCLPNTGGTATVDSTTLRHDEETSIQ